MINGRLRAFAIVSMGLLSALVGSACQSGKPAPADSASPSQDAEIAALKADIQVLKDKAPSASVAMADVGFHTSNLWFAGKEKNWPLAAYYFNEARNHIRWLIHISPSPKGPDGKPVDLKSLFDAVDTSTFAEVKTVIDNQDGSKFSDAYKAMLSSCYQCHKAVGKPYLRPMIPKALPQTIINLDTKANWPE